MASMNVESLTNGCDYPNGESWTAPSTTTTAATGRRRKAIKWSLLLLNVFFMAVGTIGGPLLLRLYYRHGGGRRWLSSFLQNAGFPILFVPLFILHMRSKARQIPASKFFIEPKLVAASAFLGLLLGLDNFMYALGLSYLPVSTSSLLFATQLAFTAIFAFLIVRHKFTPYSINSVILMTLGSIMLGLRASGDRPAGVSRAKYLMGFFFTLGSAALSGFIWPSIEFSYSKARRRVTFTTVLQFQLGVAVFASIFSVTGMAINNDFKVIPREAREYGLGNGMYYFVIAAAAVAFQLSFIGSLGVIFCSSSLLSGLISSFLLPFTEIAAVIAYKEKFSGEKGMALALSMWGFASYFYGEYRAAKEEQDLPPPQAQDQPGPF
ncbi:hypothetical protein ACLOJK_016687 [Asimina triloba]